MARFFFRLETEAGVLREMPPGCAVSLGNKAVEVHVSESGFVTEAVPPNDLKVPSSVDETKVPQLNSCRHQMHIFWVKNSSCTCVVD